MTDPNDEANERRDNWAGSILGIVVRNNRAVHYQTNPSPRWSANPAKAAWRVCCRRWDKKQEQRNRPYDHDHEDYS